MKRLGQIGLILLAIVAILGVVLVVWATTQRREAIGRAAAYVETNNIAREDGRLVLRPSDSAPVTDGFIYYPGGLVEPEAYILMGQGVADAGYLVIIPDMPLNLAFFGAGRATDIVRDFPEIEQWVIGGHSLGGAMAAQFANDNRDVVDGLVLNGSYPANPDDFSDGSLPIVSIYGSHEGAAIQIDDARPILGDAVVYVSIEGGNHAQFGDYGKQGGDPDATISAEQQQRETVAATVAFLEDVLR